MTRTIDNEELNDMKKLGAILPVDKETDYMTEEMSATVRFILHSDMGSAYLFIDEMFFQKSDLKELRKLLKMIERQL